MKNFEDMIKLLQQQPACNTTTAKQPATGAVSDSPDDSNPLALALPVVPYSHESLIDLMVANQGASHHKLAAHFGKTRGWLSSVLASDAFQLVLDPRRSEVQDPTITATMEERFRSLTLRSLSVLHDKMDSPECSDLVVLKAAELGVKALGMGQLAPVAAAPKELGSIDTLAERLTAALLKQRGNVKARPSEVVGSLEVLDAEVISDGS